MDKGSYSATIMQGNVTSVQKMSRLLRPRSWKQSVRKPRQVPTSCENILPQHAEGRAGPVAVDSSDGAEGQLNREVMSAPRSHNHRQPPLPLTTETQALNMQGTAKLTQAGMVAVCYRDAADISCHQWWGKIKSSFT